MELNTMIGIQMFSIVFIFIMLYVVRIHYKKQELPRVEAMFWSIVLLSLATIVIVPGSADAVRNLFQVSRLLDVIMIIAFMGTFIFLTENRIQISNLRSKLELVTREKAMKE